MIERWVSILLMGVFCGLPVRAAEHGMVQESDNLVKKPGFEASETALKKAWQSQGSGYVVDRAEKHTGNQSIRLTATGVGEGAVALCALPAAYLINVNKQAVEIMLQAKNAIGRVRDLVTGKTMTFKGPLALESRKPLLLELP
ncbi:MAG: hypothetical protein WA117_08285 [Verrucomicrobiia bacterium]